MDDVSLPPQPEPSPAAARRRALWPVLLVALQRTLYHGGLGAGCAAVGYIGFLLMNALDPGYGLVGSVFVTAMGLAALAHLIAACCIMFEFFYDRGRAVAVLLSPVMLLILVVPTLALLVLIVVALGSVAFIAVAVAICLWPLVIIALLLALVARK